MASRVFYSSSEVGYAAILLERRLPADTISVRRRPRRG